MASLLTLSGSLAARRCILSQHFAAHSAKREPHKDKNKRRGDPGGDLRRKALIDHRYGPKNIFEKPQRVVGNRSDREPLDGLLQAQLQSGAAVHGGQKIGIGHLRRHIDPSVDQLRGLGDVFDDALEALSNCRAGAHRRGKATLHEFAYRELTFLRSFVQLLDAFLNKSVIGARRGKTKTGATGQRLCFPGKAGETIEQLAVGFNAAVVADLQSGIGRSLLKPRKFPRRLCRPAETPTAP